MINNLDKFFLAGMLPEEICTSFDISQNYRGLQIFKWISSGVQNFSQMNNVPKAILDELKQKSY